MEGSRNKYSLCFIIAFTFLSGIKAQDTITYDLKQCIDLALKNNIDLYRSQTVADISSSRLWQSRAAFLPSLNGFISQGQNAGKSINPFTNTYVNKKIITGQYGISSSTTLWSGFYNLNTMRQNLFTYRATDMDVEQAKLDLILNVITAYLQVLSNEETLNLSRSQMELSQKQVDRVLALEKHEAVSPNVIYDTKGQLANDKLTVIDAQNALELSKLGLLQIMNTGDIKPIKLAKIDPELSQKTEDPSALAQNASQKMPLAKASEFRMMSAKKGLHASRGLMLPSLSLYASLGSNYSDAATVQHYTYSGDAASDGYVLVNNIKSPLLQPQYDITQEKISLQKQIKNNLNSYIGLNLQVPIFNSLRTKTQMSIAKINFEMATEQNQYNLNKLGIDVKRAYVNMQSARERYEVIREQSEFYSESLKIAQSKFEKGMINTVDYYFARNNSNHANLNLIVLKYDYYLKLKTLEYFSGEIK